MEWGVWARLEEARRQCLPRVFHAQSWQWRWYFYWRADLRSPSVKRAAAVAVAAAAAANAVAAANAAAAANAVRRRDHLAEAPNAPHALLAAANAPRDHSVAAPHDRLAGIAAASHLVVPLVSLPAAKRGADRLKDRGLAAASATTARNSVRSAAESDKVSDVIHFAPISPVSDQ